MVVKGKRSGVFCLLVDWVDKESTNQRINHSTTQPAFQEEKKDA
jgi:hypothetical protein